MTCLSRLTLSQKPDVAAIRGLLNPADDARRIDAHHRLVWTAFAGDPDATRDFLWRDEGDGRFIVLSEHAPRETALFESIVTKPFAPDIHAGDRLAFLLRANATHTVKSDALAPNGKRRRKHRDVVMERLHAVPSNSRSDQRMEIAQEAGAEWLSAQGERHGFAAGYTNVTGYRVHHLPGTRARHPRFGILDLEGVIEVTDPALFLDRLKLGFGRAKAFGCGLMLIRRI